MNYQQTLDYMFSQLPMFHRIGAPAYKANLDNTIVLSKLTDYPYNHFKSIHIAGTNGKGSVSSMIASILQESGFKTGLFTSPHLVDFRERIRINGEMISHDFIVGFIEKYRLDFETLKPSFFEMTFALATCWFKENKVDFAVMETGLGGRLDSTNVIKPILSIITNIGYDHMQFLGNTLKEIASEKAGIIKPGIPVIIGESSVETDSVFITKAKECGSQIKFADKIIDLKSIGGEGQAGLSNLIFDDEGTKQVIESPLVGDYQHKNIATVLASMKSIHGFISPAKLEVQRGIKYTVINTGFRGRWEILQEKPLTICDIGHNPKGFEYIVHQLKKYTYNRLHFVLGVVNDKDVSTMLEMLPKEAIYYFCKADIPRGLESTILQAKAVNTGLKGESYASVMDAYTSAKKNATLDDMVFIGGSAFVVGEVLVNHQLLDETH